MQIDCDLLLRHHASGLKGGHVDVNGDVIFILQTVDDLFERRFGAIEAGGLESPVEHRMDVIDGRCLSRDDGMARWRRIYGGGGLLRSFVLWRIVRGFSGSDDRK